MKKVLVIGEVLVEIMADTVGSGFAHPQSLTGPFPSGAPAIFADQLAKLGQPVALISAVGNDDFGRLNLNRLKGDGVDTSAIFVDDDRPTGSAFVRYRADGTRDFVFNIKHSASGLVHSGEAVNRLLHNVDHVHVMGSSLSSVDFVALNTEAARSVKARDGTVSFDPNLRKEILEAAGMRDALSRFVDLTDLFLPSDRELTLLTEADDEAEARKELMARGVKAIVHKLGSSGARFTDQEHDVSVPAYNVKEIDPTGAGDCFGGAFTAFWLRGKEPADALRYAAAAGALAVARRGPMEGTSSLREIEEFLAAKGEVM